MSTGTSETTEASGGVEAGDKSPATAGWSPRRWLLIAALLHGLAYVLILPPWMGEDEPWHVEYAHYIGRGHVPWGGREISVEDLEQLSASQVQVLREIGSIPQEEILDTQRTILESMHTHHFWERVDWAGNGDGAQTFDQVSPYLTATHQPPLYYLLSGQLLRFAGGDVLVEMWILRGLSLLAYLAVVLGSYEVARRVLDDPWMALGCAALVAWWPMHARQAAVVNNDVLVKVFGVWTLVVALEIARRGMTRGRLLLGAALAGLAILTKSTGVGSLVPLGLACVMHFGRGTEFSARRKLWGAIGLVVLLLLVPLTYFFSNNPAVPHTIGDFWQRMARSTASGFVGEFSRTSVGAFNWYSRDLPAAIQQSVGVVLLITFVSALWVLIRGRNGIHRGPLLLCLAGVVTQLSLVFLRGTAAGRYAMPMIAAFAVLIGVGWLAPWPKEWRARGTLVLVLCLLLFDGLFLWSGLVWNQYGVWGS